jgi:uncharacterized protein
MIECFLIFGKYYAIRKSEPGKDTEMISMKNDEHMINDEDRKIGSLTVLASELMPKLPYHNFNHVIDVYSATQRYGAMENVPREDMFMLGTAAMLHDIIYVSGRKDNEEMSAEFAARYLPKIGYDTRQVEKVSGLILATKMPTNPQNHLEEIICDSDVDNLGRDDFFLKGEMVRIEMGVTDDQEWYRIQLKFLESHKYYTKSAKETRNEGVKKNIRKLYNMIEGDFYAKIYAQK